MNDRARASEVLKKARAILAERLTEKILEQRDELLDDACGDSYMNEIEALYEQVGLKLSHVGQQVGYLPRYDVVWPQQVAVDTDLWTGDGAASAADGRTGEVVVVHAPNHRALKGTAALEDAVRQLQAEGLQVRLDLLQGRPNQEVRSAVLEGDIVAEQFIGGYAMFAIEGMSAARPVVSNLSWMADDLRSELDDCPIVDATPETLADRLRTLVTDPGLRARLGPASREYVLRRHSYEAVGERWAALIAGVWAASERSPSTSGT